MSCAETVLGEGWEKLYLQRVDAYFAKLCSDPEKVVMADLSSKEDTRMKVGLSKDEYSAWANGLRQPQASVQAVRKRLSAVTNKIMVETYRSAHAKAQAKKRKADYHGPAAATFTATDSSPSSA